MFEKISKPSTIPRRKYRFMSDSRVQYRYLEYEEQINSLSTKKLCETYLHHWNFHAILSSDPAISPTQPNADTKMLG